METSQKEKVPENVELSENRSTMKSNKFIVMKTKWFENKNLLRFLFHNMADF